MAMMSGYSINRLEEERRRMDREMMERRQMEEFHRLRNQYREPAFDDFLSTAQQAAETKNKRSTKPKANPKLLLLEE